MRKRFLLGLLILLIGIPLFMWLAWVIKPNTRMVMAIVDKTVLTAKGQEHISLNWVLNHQKYTKTSNDAYEVSHDYFGFFPGPDKNFQLKGLERFSYEQLERLSADAQSVYFTDTYGIYNNEWFDSGDINERSGILYGGLSDKDVFLLEKMKGKGKLIISEFNTIGSPTEASNRSRFEELFGLKWTGWTARYFDNLNLEENTEIPGWLVKNYKKTHNTTWNFKRSGIAFVNNEDKVLILEEGTHLDRSLPHIRTEEEFQKKFGLPESIKYSFWFDVIIPDPDINKVVSSFEIKTNKNGRQQMQKFGIPASFPAAIMHEEEDYSFYYFSGDFADNPVNLLSSRFLGIEYFKTLFYDPRNIMERSSFFWNYYRPLLTHILDKHSE